MGTAKRKDGAVRVYKLAPMSADDALEHVRRKLAHRGWTVLDDDVSLATSPPYVWVSAWAIPPAPEPEPAT